MKFLVVAVLLLFVGISSQVQAQLQPATPCPLNFVARVTEIDGPASQVKLVREGKQSSVEVDQCLFANDHIDAGLASVRIETMAGPIRIGRHQEFTSYDVGQGPKAYHYGDMSALERGQQFYNQLSKLPRLSAPGLGRAGSSGCEKRSADSARRLSPLRRLPEGHQRVGSDLAMLLISWSPTLGREEITVRLSRGNGTDKISEQRVCGVAHTALTIPPGLVKPGDTLIATVTTQTGEVLTWSIEIVAPTSLLHPPDHMAPAWMLGAWRMEAGGVDIQMDAVSRVASGASDYLAAQEILSATLANLE